MRPEIPAFVEGKVPGRGRTPWSLRTLIWRIYRTVATAARVTRLTTLAIGRHTLGERLDYFIRRWILSTNAPTITRINGYQMELLPWLYECSPEFRAGVYEDGTTRLLEEILSEGMTVIDCGAHIGYYTLLAARRVGESGRVFAFEPHPESFGALQKNIALNGYRNVVTLQEAVADQAGLRTLYASKRRTGTDSLYAPASRSGGLAVQVTTLDEFLEGEGWPQIHLIKLDIEGAENAALDGAQKFLQRQDSVNIVVEFSPENLKTAGVEPDKFLARLERLGFRVRVIQNRGGLLPLNALSLPLQIVDGSYVNLFCEK
jgi:FkbM family methyltransferase